MESEHDDSTGSIGFDGRGHEQLGLTTRHDPAEGTEAQQEARQAAEVEQEQVHEVDERNEATDEEISVGIEAEGQAEGQAVDAQQATRRLLDEIPQEREGARHERPHPGHDADQARQAMRSERKERKGREQSELIRRAGDQLQALIAALTDIASVCDGSKRWCVVQADCLEIMRCLPERLVAHVITDPPYSAAVHSRSIRRTYLPDVADQPCRKTRAFAFGFDHLTRELCAQYAGEFLRVASRWVATFADVEIDSWWRESFGDTYVRTGVWVKDRAMPQISGDRPSSRVEHIVIAHRKGQKRWNARPDGGDSNVWQCPVVANCNGHRTDRIHTAQKPVEIMLDLVESFTDRNDLILDPFAGSGTTGVAALRLGRRVIVIERDETYAKLCVERMTAEEAGSTLLAARAKQVPLYGAT